MYTCSNFNRSYCEMTRNVDNMIDRFSRDKDVVVSMLEENTEELVQKLWSPISPVCKDEKCMFRVGKSISISIEQQLNMDLATYTSSMINFYICPQCINMKRLVDFSKTRIGQPFEIECGEKKGSQMIINETPLSKLYLMYEKISKPATMAINNRLLHNTIKSSDKLSRNNNIKILSNIEYLESDAYTNNLLINWYLDDKLTKIEMPHIMRSYISFVCNDNGYNLNEYVDIFNMSEFQEYPKFLTSLKSNPVSKKDDKSTMDHSVVKSIIMQLFALLKELKSYDFSHGNPSSKTIKFKNKSCSYMYDGVQISSPVTLKIHDFEHAGITVKRCNGDLRLYSKSVIANEILKTRTFNPIVEVKDYKPFTIYKLKDSKHFIETILFMYLKHLGLPIYQSSFDAYAFTMALMSERSFYLSIVNDSELYKFWRSMWLPDEVEIIQNRILDLYKNKNTLDDYESIFSVLKGLSLRCDIVDHCWSQIEKW